MEIALTAIAPSSPNNTVLLLLPGRSLAEQAAHTLGSCLDADFHVYVLRSAPPASKEVLAYSKVLAAELSKRKIKQCTVLGISAGGSLAQALAIHYPKLVRRLALVDAIPRVAPSRFLKAIDTIEDRLPLGLPFRSLSEDFDSRPALHRIHCPSLILRSPQASSYEGQQWEMLARRIPNAWSHTLRDQAVNKALLSEEMKELLHDFIEVPAKRPQKNLPSTSV